MEQEGRGCDLVGTQVPVGMGGSGESVCVGIGIGAVAPPGVCIRRGGGAHGMGLDYSPSLHVSLQLSRAVTTHSPIPTPSAAQTQG